MIISERTLKKWRKESLAFNDNLTPDEINAQLPSGQIATYIKLKDANIRIIKMTQELLDQHLLNK